MTDPDKTRLDQALVERRLIVTRARARDAVLRGLVCVDGIIARKPGLTVRHDTRIELTEDPAPYVSRAGEKLAHGLDHFGIDPTGHLCLDIGASTGGFTEVLLKRGAVHVYAVDVGHGQMHESLRKDPRVTVLERLNVRDLTSDHLPSPPGIIVCDVSFISLTLALPPALALAAPGAQLIALIKPQFEVGRENLGKGGIVRDPSLHNAVCNDICTWLEQDKAWVVKGLLPSPVEGSDGNREFLVSAWRQTVSTAPHEA